MRGAQRRLLVYLGAAILVVFIFHHTNITENNGLCFGLGTIFKYPRTKVNKHDDAKDKVHQINTGDVIGEEYIGKQKKLGVWDSKQFLPRNDRILHNAKRNNTRQPASSKNHIYHGHDMLQDPVYAFDPHFKNPCWYENDGSGEGTLRCLPYVFIIGVKKCGTTDLYSRLAMHPGFVKPDFIKESHFFAKIRFRSTDSDSIDNYVKMFDHAASKISASRMHGYNGDLYNNWSITGDASPSSLHLNSHWKYLPGNENLDEPKYVILDYIHHFLPKAKSIVIFRDPIERLYSDYYHEFGHLMPENSPNPREFHTIVKKGLLLYQRCFASRTVRSCVYDPDLYHKTKIQIQLGIYYVFWQDLLRVYPRDQILVLQNKDLKDTKKTMATVYEFLGLRKPNLEEWDRILNREANFRRSVSYREQGAMMNETFDMLLAFYKPFNVKMTELTHDVNFMYSKRVS